MARAARKDHPLSMRLLASDIAIIDRLGVIDDPVQSVERHIAVHFLEYIECPRDRLVVGRVQPPGVLFTALMFGFG